MKHTVIAASVVLVACFTLLSSAPSGRGLQPAGVQPGGVPQHFTNARLDTQAVSSNLEQAFRSIAASQQSPAWAGYSVPAVPGEHHMCDNCAPGGCGTTYLEGRRSEVTMTEAGRKVALEAPPSVTVLFRIERASVQKIRVFSPDCELDAGGLPVHWLAPVNPAESVALLSSYVKPSAGRSGSRDEPSDNAALTAIAMHAGPAASQALDRFVAPGQPDSVRKHAAFWLGAARGREGFETLRRLARNEADGAFRKELVFPISLSKEPEATDVLIQLAREDKSGEVRKQALFWLGQKAGAKAVATLTDAIANDPDTAVKERAVFALSQLPKDEGVPRLIEVARTNRNPEIRKRAMFWLGQSNDPRALSFFEEILVHK